MVQGAGGRVYLIISWASGSLASADTATSTNVFKICFGSLHLEVFLGVETFPDKEGVKEYKKFEN